MRHNQTCPAPAERRHGRHPNEDDIGKPSNIGGETELDPVAPEWSGHLEREDLDSPGCLLIGGAEHDDPDLVLDDTKEGPADPTPDHD